MFIQVSCMMFTCTLFLYYLCLKNTMKAILIPHGDHPCGFHILINSVQAVRHLGNWIFLFYFTFWFCTFPFEFSLASLFPSIFMPLSQAVGQWAVGLFQCPRKQARNVLSILSSPCCVTFHIFFVIVISMVPSMLMKYITCQEGSLRLSCFLVY